MDDSKPLLNPKDFHEGEEATKRFVQGVRNVLSTSPVELKKRHDQWEKERKGKKRSNRS